MINEPRCLRFERTQYGKEIRKKYESGEVKERIGNMRKLAVRPDYITNTLTGVLKDNHIIVPENFKSEYKEKEIKPMEKNGFTVNDLFCGGGGFGLGFKNEGFEIKSAYDFDKYAVQTYAHNVGDHVQQADIAEMKGEDIPYADTWTFGFPCQDLSIAGKQAGLIKGTRSNLFFQVMRLLQEVEHKPKIIVAENVKGLKKYLPLLKQEYEANGYDMHVTMYNSKFWDVPQNRERYFVVGTRKDLDLNFQFEEQQTEYIPRLVEILEENVDEKFYIDDLKATKIIEQAREGLKVKQATKKGYDVAKEGDSINISHPNSKTRRGRVGKQVSQTLLTGQEQLVVQPKIENIGNTNPSGRGMNGNVYDSEGISPTCTTNKGEGHKVTDGLRVRKLTPREYARLQGFPDSFEQVVSNTQFYKQMGNAVTVNVAQAVARSVKECLANESK